MITKIIEYFRDTFYRMDVFYKKSIEKRQKENIENYIINIDDKIVKNTSFFPLESWWFKRKTHTFFYDKSWNIVLKLKIDYYILIILLIPIIVISKFLFNLKKWLLNSDMIILYLIIIFIVISIILIFFSLSYLSSWTKIFNFENWFFYNKKYENKINLFYWNEKYKDKIILISSIHALQIISEYISWSKHNFTSYELNLILKDSSRINIIDNWDLEEIRKIAQEISLKLKVKNYDLTQNYIDMWY